MIIDEPAPGWPSRPGRIICLSTPYGKRGFFHEAWAAGGADWTRITAVFLEKERRAVGESWFRQEYCCSFESLEGLVYPDFKRCLGDSAPTSLAPLRSSRYLLQGSARLIALICRQQKNAYQPLAPARGTGFMRRRSVAFAAAVLRPASREVPVRTWPADQWPPTAALLPW